MQKMMLLLVPFFQFVVQTLAEPFAVEDAGSVDSWTLTLHECVVGPAATSVSTPAWWQDDRWMAHEMMPSFYELYGASSNGKGELPVSYSSSSRA